MLAADLLVASDCRFHFVARPRADPRTLASREPLDSRLSLSILLLRPTPHGLKLTELWLAALVSESGGSADEALERTLTVLLLDGHVVKTDEASLSEPHPLRVPSLTAAPGSVAIEQSLFPRYPLPVNDGTQAMPYRVTARLFLPDGLGLGLLPVGLFSNPHSAFTSDLAAQYRLNLYTVHADVSQGLGLAVSRLRSRGLWTEPPAAPAPSSFLVAALVVPPRLLTPLSEQKSEQELLLAHTQLLSWQLERVADLLALAQALSRALVLPQLLCACDEGEQGAACVAGELPPPPFACAAGAVLRSDLLSDEAEPWREARAAPDGGPLMLRESGFLSLPAATRAGVNASDAVVLRPCDGGAMRGGAMGREAFPPCFGDGERALAPLMEVEGGRTAAQAAAQLAAAAGVAVLRLELAGDFQFKATAGGEGATAAFNARFAAAAGRVSVRPIGAEG